MWMKQQRYKYTYDDIKIIHIERIIELALKVNIGEFLWRSG